MLCWLSVKMHGIDMAKGLKCMIVDDVDDAQLLVVEVFAHMKMLVRLCHNASAASMASRHCL